MGKKSQKMESGRKSPILDVVFVAAIFTFGFDFGSLEGSLAECTASKMASNDHSNDKEKHEGTKLESDPPFVSECNFWGVPQLTSTYVRGDPPRRPPALFTQG